MGRECKYYEITVEKLFNVVHRYTEPIKIHVVAGAEGLQDKVKDFYITENIAKSQEEIDRVMKYYADVPVWNLHIDFDGMRCKSGEVNCNSLIASIVANCHYKDVREGYLREKEDNRKAKRKEYRERKKVKEKPNENHTMRND